MSKEQDMINEMERLKILELRFLWSQNRILRKIVRENLSFATVDAFFIKDSDETYGL